MRWFITTAENESARHAAINLAVGIIDADHEVVARWLQNPEPLNIEQELQGVSASLEDLAKSDAAVFLLGYGNGNHDVLLGAAIALNKRVVRIGTSTSIAAYQHPFVEHYENAKAFLRDLKKQAE